MRPRHLATAAVLAVALMAGCGNQTDSGSVVVAEPSVSVTSATEDADASGRETGPMAPAEPSERSTSVSDPTEDADASGREIGLACTAVWVDGAEFPRGYEGCTAEGAYVKATWRHCASGERLYTYGDRYYSVPGGVIGASDGPLLDDPDYVQVLAACAG